MQSLKTTCYESTSADRAAPAGESHQRRVGSGKKRLSAAIQAMLFLAITLSLLGSATPTAAALQPARLDALALGMAPAALPQKATAPKAVPRAKVGKPYTKVSVTGGTAAQRSKIKGWLKKWGKYTNIRSITISTSLSNWGLTDMYPDGSAVIRLRKSLGTGNKFRYTFLHELAHAQAIYVYNGEYTAANNALQKQFGAIKRNSFWKGFEAAADCGANYMSGSKQYLYYKTAGCTSAQKSRAKQIASGYRV